MGKLVNQILSQTRSGSVMYMMFNEMIGLENANMVDDLKEMVRGSYIETTEELKRSDPSYQPTVMEPLDIIVKYFEVGSILIQMFDQQITGYAVLAITESAGGKECKILDSYISQNFKNQHFEEILIEGIVTNVKVSGVRTIEIKTTVADESLMDALEKNEFKPEEIKFRLNI